MMRFHRFSDRNRLVACGPGLACLLLLAGCSAPVTQHDLEAPDEYPVAMEADADTLDVIAVDGAEESALPAEEGYRYAGLDLLFPEIREMDDMYRQGLEALWSGDLDAAQGHLNALDAAMNSRNDAMNPLATIYYNSISERAENLSELIDEMRYFESTMSRIDSLGVIHANGAVDSLALSQLFENPVDLDPDNPRYDFELVENPLVERWIRYFTGDGRMHMEKWLARKPKYEKVIYEILDEYNLSRDMIYLAMIESGLSMKARSYANAVGPWQFISSTGRIYGLKIDWWVDERRDLEKATRAASSHLSDLYESFGSWPLAFAAYNAGSRRVERAVRRHGTRDFWQLSSLPRQTRNYVPKFMAALLIGHDPEAYGFHVDPSLEEETYDVVEVEDATDLHLIAELADCKLEDVINLNPHLKRWSTPPGEPYQVRVPYGRGEITTTKLATVPPEDRVRWRRHRVKRGESLSLLARRYGTSVSAIKQANNLRRTTIHAGTYLLIPVVSGSSSVAQEHIAAAALASGGETVSYRVRRGDTLGRIAKRYGVTVSQLKSWNGKSNSRIYVGETLVMNPSGGPQGERITYVVKRGDTLSVIARRHRVSVKQLMSWNKKRTTRIVIGERLRIYKG
jgi:membrane-bound lytic murein transglycosylase D